MDRIRVPEIMDDEALAVPLHRDALAALSRINTLSHAAQRFWKPLRRHARDRRQKLRVLDLACGGGDILLELWRLTRRESEQWEFAGCDKSGVALDMARERASAAGASIEYFKLDILDEEIPERFDVVINSLSLHHFDAQNVTAILEKMARAQLVVVSDLRRSRTGLVLAHLAGHVLARSPVVRVDGPRSVRAAYTIPEMRAMAENAGMLGARIDPVWPCRMLLQWKR